MVALRTLPIFQGVTPIGALRAMAQWLDGKSFNTFHIPCVGQFTVPEALASLNIQPFQISTGDITFYSSVIGYALDQTKEIDDLGFKVEDGKLAEFLDGLPSASTVEKAVRMLIAVKYAQLCGSKDYIVWYRRELVAQRLSVAAQLTSGLESLRAHVMGLNYNIIDAEIQLQPHLSDGTAFVWYNPPGYKKGYTKMFEALGQYSWHDPKIAEINPKQVSAYLDLLSDADAAVMVYGTEGRTLDPGSLDGWEKLYTDVNPKNGVCSHLLCNRLDASRATLKRRVKLQPAKVPPVFDDHTITPDSKIEFIRTDEQMALYFYDLFVRELATTTAVVFYLFCIDGQVAGTIGMDHRSYMMYRSGPIYETFGLSIPSMRYARLGRLLMMCLCSQQFVDQFTGEAIPESLLLEPVRLIQTACLTKFAEAKKNRGILKLIARKQLDNGRFHLTYQTAPHQTTFKSCLQAWLDKHANKTRE
jgi:hypothetical protein